MAQAYRGMLPVGELMIEHRLIDRMLILMRIEIERIGELAARTRSSSIPQ